jgi:hypothetical protein
MYFDQEGAADAQAGQGGAALAPQCAAIGGEHADASAVGGVLRVRIAERRMAALTARYIEIRRRKTARPA